MALPEIPDWHTTLLNEALAAGSPVPGELEDYVALRESQDPIAAFDLFVKRWVHPSWHPHLMDSDDNEAEYVRRAIRNGLAMAACAGFGTGAAAVEQAREEGR